MQGYPARSTECILNLTENRIHVPKVPMQNTLKPFVFINGDGGTGRGAEMVRRIIFANLPTVDVPLHVDARLQTKDQCIADAVEALKLHGSGFKNSTASNDSRIVAAGLKSANIAMRPMARAFCMLRMLQSSGKYSLGGGVARFAHGGFYDETSFQIIQKGVRGRRVAYTSQKMDVDALVPFAELASQIAEKHGFHIVLSSKSTIAESEFCFRQEIERVWKSLELEPGEAKNGAWTGDYHHELTDVALAGLATPGTPFADGGMLMVCDNPNGDTASDIMDFIHGGRSMGSRVYCETDKPGQWFSYEELPGGTADGKTTGPLRGKNFLFPLPIIFAMCSAAEKVNPDQKTFFDAVRRETVKYLEETPTEKRDTEAMIAQVADQSRDALRIPEVTH